MSPANVACRADVAPAVVACRRYNPSKFYEELRYLGSGAFGAAVLVRRRKDGRRFVAKKCCIKDMPEKQRIMCLAEIELLLKVRHHCVAEVIDFRWTSKDRLDYWIVMKYYAGGDVQQEIERCKDENLEIPLGKCQNWAVQLCTALEHVHRLRIVHRDVKGSNLFVTGAQNIVLGDFGVSKQLTVSSARAMTSVGSPVYMAPECWDGRGGTAASDMWSVGVVLYELMALKRPFEAGNVLSLVHKITNEEPPPLSDAICGADLNELMKGLLAKEPSQRTSASQALKASWLCQAADLLKIWRNLLEGASEKQMQQMARQEDIANGRCADDVTVDCNMDLESSLPMLRGSKFDLASVFCPEECSATECSDDKSSDEGEIMSQKLCSHTESGRILSESAWSDIVPKTRFVTIGLNSQLNPGSAEKKLCITDGGVMTELPAAFATRGRSTQLVSASYLEQHSAAACGDGESSDEGVTSKAQVPQNQCSHTGTLSESAWSDIAPKTQFSTMECDLELISGSAEKKLCTIEGGVMTELPAAFATRCRSKQLLSASCHEHSAAECSDGEFSDEDVASKPQVPQNQCSHTGTLSESACSDIVPETSNVWKHATSHAEERCRPLFAPLSRSSGSTMTQFAAIGCNSQLNSESAEKSCTTDGGVMTELPFVFAKRGCSTHPLSVPTSDHEVVTAELAEKQNLGRADTNLLSRGKVESETADCSILRRESAALLQDALDETCVVGGVATQPRLVDEEVTDSEGSATNQDADDESSSDGSAESRTSENSEDDSQDEAESEVCEEASSRVCRLPVADACLVQAKSSPAPPRTKEDDDTEVFSMRLQQQFLQATDETVSFSVPPRCAPHRTYTRANSYARSHSVLRALNVEA